MINILNNSDSQASAANSGGGASSANPSVPKISRIEVKRDLCIGAQTCVALAPDVFEMDAENKAIIKSANGNDDETILMAARSCPTLAIFLYDEKGTQVFP